VVQLLEAAFEAALAYVRREVARLLPRLAGGAEPTGAVEGWQHERLFAEVAELLAGVTAIGRRFQLNLAWLGVGTRLGALVPALGMAIIAAFILYYWLPISGEIARARRRRERRMRSDRRDSHEPEFASAWS
jgi:hypothetical protein